MSVSFCCLCPSSCLWASASCLSVCLPHTHGPRPGPSSAPGQRGRHPDCGWAAFCPLACDGDDEGHHVAGPLHCAQGTGPPAAVGPTQGARDSGSAGQCAPLRRGIVFFSPESSGCACYPRSGRAQACTFAGDLGDWIRICRGVCATGRDLTGGTCQVSHRKRGPRLPAEGGRVPLPHVPHWQIILAKIILTAGARRASFSS